MATSAGPTRGKRGAAGTASETARATDAGQGPMTWLVLQGDVIDEVEGDEPPSTEVQPGERRKRILGGSRNPEQLQRLRDTYYPLARGITGKGQAY